MPTTYFDLPTNTEALDPNLVRTKYACLTNTLIAKHLTITTMESCTSGQIASLITDTEGASAILKGAFITYSNQAKILAGIPESTINTYGVYSPQTAIAMAQTCKATMSADIGLGITGTFSNPDPSNTDSIPGDVYFAISASAFTQCFHCKIPTQSSRLNYKLFVADLVADQLFQILSTLL